MFVGELVQGIDVPPALHVPTLAAGALHCSQVVVGRGGVARPTQSSLLVSAVGWAEVRNLHLVFTGGAHTQVHAPPMKPALERATISVENRRNGFEWISQSRCRWSRVNFGLSKKKI